MNKKGIIVILAVQLLLSLNTSFGQSNNHATIKVAKVRDGTYLESNAAIKIGNRIVHDNDTISGSLILNAGRILIADSAEDTFITSFISEIPFNGGDAQYKSNSAIFPTQIILRIANRALIVNGTTLYISKVCYKTASGENYIINKGITLKLVGYPPAPMPPADTIPAWEAKFILSVNGVSEGKISRKRLLNAKKIDITGPTDSTFITSFEMYLQSTDMNMYETARGQHPAYAKANANEITKEMRTIIKKAAAYTSVTITNINCTVNGKNYALKKGLTFVLE